MVTIRRFLLGVVILVALVGFAAATLRVARYAALLGLGPNVVYWFIVAGVVWFTFVIANLEVR